MHVLPFPCLSLSDVFTCAHNGIRHRKGIRILFRLNIAPLPLLPYKISIVLLAPLWLSPNYVPCNAPLSCAVHISNSDHALFLPQLVASDGLRPDSELSTSLNYLNPLPRAIAGPHQQ